MKRADYVDACQIFMDRYGSTNTVAEELGLSIKTVRKYLTIGRLPKKIKELVKKGDISVNNAIKALDALGGDEENVDEEMLIETAYEIQKLSPQARKKFVEIKIHEPSKTTSEVSETAKKQAEINRLVLEVTDDQISRIKKFQQNEGMSDTEEAAEELIDIGLDTSEI